MFGALAGKLLVEGRRPILLNHQAGEGGLPIQKYIENFKKEFTSNLPNIISSQFPQLFQKCFYYFELYIIFLKATLK